MALPFGTLYRFHAHRPKTLRRLLAGELHPPRLLHPLQCLRQYPHRGRSMTESIATTAPPYRQGTTIAKTKVCLVFNVGGIGDYIHWIGAMKYVIDSNPHIHGHILSPPYFLDLAKLWLDGYSDRFTVVGHDGVIEESPYVQDCAAVGPNNQQLANACGFHLTELGFIYYTQKRSVVSEYATLPEIRGDEVSVDHLSLPKNYAVIPVDATADNRRLPAEVVNSLTKHLLTRGVTPVLLGKEELASDYISKRAEGIKTRDCIDLRNKTTLIEAAVILARARFVLGMDGGLLHLASCSSVPVVFIFTSVHPDFRIPQRKAGRQTIVITPPKELHCRFCNTGEPGKPSMTYVIGHDFKNCLYGDNLCTKIIDAKTLIPVVDKLLKETHGN